MFGDSGLRDWKIQRVSAVFLAAAVVGLVAFFVTKGLDYSAWKALMALGWVKMLSITAVFSLLSHAWIGVWTIATDYVKCSAIRLSILSLFAVALIGYGAWAIQIVWSV